jgi:amidase
VSEPTPDFTDSSDLTHWSATQLSGAIRDGAVRCVDVMTAALDRIEAINPTINAVVSLRPRVELLARAAAYDAELARRGPRGWLHGIPYAAKDLMDVAGLPTTYGLLRPDEAGAAAADSWAIARVRAAGAIIIGKTNTSELGLGSHTFNEVFGVTRNPWNPAWTAGGSSGGAAAAVAARLVPVADGSDFFGSLRSPAGWCQVYGLRPTPGVIPDAGDDPHTLPAGVTGPMARSADDLRALFETMAGPHSQAPFSWPVTGAVATLGHPLQIGWLGDLQGYLPTAPHLVDATLSALDPLITDGARVSDASLTGDGFDVARDLWPTWLTLRHSQAGGGLLPLYDDPAIRDRLKPEARFEVEGYLGVAGQPGIGPRDVVACSASRAALLRRCLSLFEQVDVLALPTASVFPFPVEWRWPEVIDGTPMSTYHRWMEVTAPATLAGLPVLGLPVGLDAVGRPLGVQLIAPPHAEQRLLAIAEKWESVAGPPRVPPLPTG